MGPNENSTPTAAPQAPRRGEFLALRLVAAVGISVLLALLAANAISLFIELLVKGQPSLLDTLIKALMNEVAILTGTMLLALAVVPWLLFKSIKASLISEPRFTQRTVYKVTMYGGLAILAAATGFQLIAALAAVISSLVQIGVAGADIGGVYLRQFLPAIAGALVTGFAAFCFWQTDRGKDKINLLSLVLTIVSAAFGLALIIATAVALHNPATPSSPFGTPAPSLDGGSTEDSSQDLRSPSFEDSEGSSSGGSEDYSY